MSGSDELHAGGGRRPIGGSQCIRRVALELEEDSEEEALREEEEAYSGAAMTKTQMPTGASENLIISVSSSSFTSIRVCLSGRGGLSKARERRCTQCAACEALQDACQAHSSLPVRRKSVAVTGIFKFILINRK
ncbi:hypothetical protein HaLaN_15464 [Haematococcus lacustris]|uniref:Uncharacterized protein n=1 Tax=Haematococcus lacustris TaxID=44745 RepID=A0A699ZGR7_HAELA|nr:hypothetical protein HaLaN_15464 [Haematococcus lacustris]